MTSPWKMISAVLLVTLLTACGSESSSSAKSQGTSSYKETKTMVLDILKSDDGKKAIINAGESLANSTGGLQIKQMSANETMQMQLAVKEVLTDTNNQQQLLTKLMTDPKFAGDFAKAIQKENKQLQKDLMKDPDYQKSVINLMKSPDYEQIVLDTMKGQQYRQQTMTIIQESMQSPLFRAEMVELMKKAIEEQLRSQSIPSGQAGQKSQSGGGKEQGQGQQKSGEGNQDQSSSQDEENKKEKKNS